MRLRSAALHVARQRRAVRRALKRIVEVIEGSWWWLARRPWPLVDACMRHTIVGVNQVTLHGVVVVGVAGRCGTWHHCRHVGLEKKPCVHGSRANSPIGRYRGLLERLCCPQCNAQALGNLHSEGALLDSASIPPTGKA